MSRYPFPNSTHAAGILSKFGGADAAAVTQCFGLNIRRIGQRKHLKSKH